MSNRHFFTWLYKYSRGINVKGENVSVLRSPDEFYQTILDQIRGARRRVKMSSLYLGTGELERELVRCISSSLQMSPHLKCSLLLDYLRGTRGCVNSVTTLIDLLRSSPRTCLHLYHTPLLHGAVKQLIPERFNEGVGLQHTKLLVFDDNVIMTGANLSNDYFTKRRDRYILFKNSRELSDYVATFYDIICDNSYLVKPDGRESWTTVTPVFDPSTEPVSHVTSMEIAVKQLMNLTNHSKSTHGNQTDSCSTPRFQSSTSIKDRTRFCSPDSHSDQPHSHSTDTVVFPLIQMGPYNIQQDELLTTELLSTSRAQDQLYLASGYFNPPPEYTSAILKGQGSVSVLAASPQANGFYGAKGVAKYTPFMYMHYAKVFLEMVHKQHANTRINYHEYIEDGWVFHSKGFRSLTRDLEFQVAVVTDNKLLQGSLHNEMGRLFSKGKRLTLQDVQKDNTRRLSPLVLWTTKLLQKFV